MGLEHGTTLLFGLAGVAVREVRLGGDGTRVVEVVTDDETAAACPTCGVFSSSRKPTERVPLPRQDLGLDAAILAGRGTRFTLTRPTSRH